MLDGNSRIYGYRDEAKEVALAVIVVQLLLSPSADEIFSHFYRQLVWVVVVKRYF